MSDIRQTDDLSPEEIRDVDEFYANDDGKKKMSFDEFLQELDEF